MYKYTSFGGGKLIFLVSTDPAGVKHKKITDGKVKEEKRNREMLQIILFTIIKHSVKRLACLFLLSSLK